MSAHEKGPWAAQGLDIVSGKRIVAFMPTCFYAEQKTRNANARLIAAAPDMLAALIRLSSVAYDMGDATNCNHADEAIADAITLLARIEGDEP